MNLSQRQLRLFVTTAALMNMSRAAEALHVSQPALTRALQEFESQLGVALFHRTTRRIALTHDGERLLPIAQRLLIDLDQVAGDLRERAAGLAGHVTLAVGSAFGCAVLGGALRRFATTHPRVQVRVIDDNSAGITRRVALGEVDLGIGSPMGDTRLLDCALLLTAPIGLLMNTAVFRLDKAVGIDQLAGLPLLKESDDTSIMQTLRSRGSGLVAQVGGGVEVNSLALQLAFARAGVGIAVMSALGASHPDAQGLRFVPLRPTMRREVFAMHRRDRPPSACAAALLQAIRSTTSSEVLHKAVVVARPGAARRG
jgi:LysR family transcriptional regulator, carnitine catabolism transcriptional activator